MKKSFVLAAAVCLVLSACTKKAYIPGTFTPETIRIGFVYPGSIFDGGYNQAHDAGRIALMKKGIKCYFVENVPEDESSVVVFTDLVKQGCDVIYAVSMGYEPYILEVAEKNSNVKFAYVGGSTTAHNVSTYYGKMYEARYLAGIAAGLKTSSNKIGYVAAYQNSECIRGINAFALGVKSVNADAIIDVLWTKNWNDPEEEEYRANELLARGCDVLTQHQNSSAVLQAAQRKKAFCIGYNSPATKAAPDAYLTAAIFNWKVFILDDVENLLNGTWTERNYWEGLEKGIVDIDELSPLCVPVTRKKIEEEKAAIIAGTRKIFAGPLYDNKGNLRVKESDILTEDEIWNMDWLVDNISGDLR